MGGLLKRSGLTALAVLAAVLFFAASRAAHAQLQFSSADGSTSLKLGFLGQIQGESVQNATNTNTENDIYFRRLRLLGLFKLGDKLSVYFDTDDPNYGKGTGNGGKNSTTDMYIQDAVVTYSFAHEFQLDGGLILTPNSYNHLTSAGALMPIDYGTYTFIEADPLLTTVGRDWGTQIRGYLGNDHLEYRFGVYQGLRGEEDTNSFRYVGRLSLYVFGAETGLFYRGTSLGKTQTMEFGGSVDKQKDYSWYDGDFFWDQPVGNGDGVTVQFDYANINGGVLVPTLPKQHTLMGELGYYVNAIKTQPFFQYNEESYSDGVLPNLKHITFGLGWYFTGSEASNLKLAYSRLSETGTPDHNEWQLQYQVFIW
jgi:hypothetical protein